MPEQLPQSPIQPIQSSHPHVAKSPTASHPRKRALLLGFTATIGIICIVIGAFTLGTQKKSQTFTAITPKPVSAETKEVSTDGWSTYINVE